jgi:glyoxylase-like metal-dependent hydrolase (beta-lactamase superfamily II)
MHLGRDRVICAHLVDGFVVDPGPSTGLDALLEGLGEEEPRGLLLTHVHLDHAGAAGTLARRFPDLTVYVHEVGAPHLVDPSRLLRSVARLQGDIDRLWGPMEPVPEERMRVLSGGETVEGFRVEYTPGHASHHVCYLHEATGDAYVGDVAGIRIPPGDYVLAPTPPPDIDVEAWLDSIETVAAWSPASLNLTHFGRFEEDVDEHLERMRGALARLAELARGREEQSFIEGIEQEVRAEAGDDLATRIFRVAPSDQLWLGLERYWRKREELATP